MRAVCQFFVAFTSLLFAAAPAAALVITPALDGSDGERWALPDGKVLEFDDHDWAIFICDDTSEFLLSALDAVDENPGDVEGLVTQVWARR
jgi:hypothetical protein